MLGKALIATILGAGVTGGAVYLAQHPEVLDGTFTPKPVIESGAETEVAASDAETPKINSPDSNLDTAPQTNVPTAPVLPEAQQLTVRHPLEPATAPSSVKATADETTATLIAQAKQIRSADLRDQAYLGVVDYALFTDDYGSAIEAMEALQQPQLRDTARANIAVKYAKAGSTQEAFALIEQVEIDELRDFMRLQVIDAMTGGQE